MAGQATEVQMIFQDAFCSIPAAVPTPIRSVRVLVAGETSASPAYCERARTVGCPGIVSRRLESAMAPLGPLDIDELSALGENLT